MTTILFAWRSRARRSKSSPQESAYEVYEVGSTSMCSTSTHSTHSTHSECSTSAVRVQYLENGSAHPPGLCLYEVQS
jgi:hypothetical protein